MWGFDHNVSYFDWYVRDCDQVIRHFDINAEVFCRITRDLDLKVRDLEWNFWVSGRDSERKVRAGF